MSSHGCVQSNVYTAAVTYIHLATLSDWKYTLQASEVKTFPARLSCRSLLCLLFIFRPHLCHPVLCASNPPDWGEDIGLSMSWRSTFGQMREEEIVPNGWSQVGPLWSKRWLGGRNTEETSRPKENIKQQTGVVAYLWFMDWQCKIFCQRSKFLHFLSFFVFFPTKTVEIRWNWGYKIFSLKIRRCKFLDKFHVCLCWN